MGSARREKFCVFCGGEPVTKEHLWSDWIRELLTDKTATHRHVREQLEGKAQTWEAPPFTAVVRCVCEGCNSRWMSDLETEAIPHLKPLIQGKRRIVGSKAQGAIARWAYLKVLMFDQWRGADGKPVVERQRYADFMRDHVPPERTRVVVAAYLGGRRGKSLGRYVDRTLHLSEPRSSPGEDPDGFLATFTINCAVLQVFGHDRGLELDLIRPGRLDALSERIWPTRMPFVWPPESTSLSHDALLEFEQPTGRARRSL